MTHVWLCWDMEIEQLHSQYQDIMQLPTDATLLEPLQLHSHICVMMDGKGLSTKAQQTEPNQAAPASDEQAQTLHDDAKLRCASDIHRDNRHCLCAYAHECFIHPGTPAATDGGSHMLHLWIHIQVLMHAADAAACCLGLIDVPFVSPIQCIKQNEQQQALHCL